MENNFKVVEKPKNNVYQSFIKPLLFKLDPELVHDLILMIGNFLGKFKIARKYLDNKYNFKSTRLEQEIDGLFFPNPLGLSAGFDKDGYLLETLPRVGFGYSLVGTVTFKPYGGNKKPRLVRFPNEKAVLVNYGLKNQGVHKIINRYQKRKNKKFISGISIGKTNSQSTTTCEMGIEDYSNCYQFAVSNSDANFFEINISCPNTFGGEPFTNPNDLELLLTELEKHHDKRPVYLKMPINVTDSEFLALCQTANNFDFIKGLSIGNLQKNTQYIFDKYKMKKLKGGLSGQPTQVRSTELIKLTRKNFKNRFTIIGIGGIFTGKDAFEKLEAGADLLAGITGLIYNGPNFASQINKELLSLMDQRNLKTIKDFEKLRSN